jgi:radical SAM superfamily enzyme YgiQ (UPF0313 family)
MKVLLVYPQYPDTFWSFSYVLRFIRKEAFFPPLGLLTIAAMLPNNWEKKLMDLNVSILSDGDLLWADYVFISAMIVQQNSAREIVDRCKMLGVKTVAGGPLFTSAYKELGFDDIDHLVLGEGEITLPLFLSDIRKNHVQHVYTSSERPEITQTPVPLWSLINTKDYATLGIQYSRGCPFDCDFCEVIVLNGRNPRTKTKEQIEAELDALNQLGYEGPVFFVDDNFIGNKQKLKTSILPSIIKWSEANKRPFTFFTQASINLADDEELMRLMTDAGFDTVFIGIESPNTESLSESNKLTNMNRDLLTSIKKLQRHGFQVQGGFIIGFDSDPVSIFESQINFIQSSGIVSAMIGLLYALPGSRLYQRLQEENRLLPSNSGDFLDGRTNFIPRMRYDVLVNGYRNVLNSIYSPRQHYERIKTFFKEYESHARSRVSIKRGDLIGIIKTVWFFGLKENERVYYWRLLIPTLLKTPVSLD